MPMNTKDAHNRITSYGAGDSLLVGRSGDRIPVGARFSTPVQTGPGVHPVSYTIGAWSAPGVNRPGRGVDHPPSSDLMPWLKKECHYTSTPPPLPPVGPRGRF